MPKEAFDNWQLVEKLPFVIGDFVWTGMDYIGESGIGYSIYPELEDDKVFLMSSPTYISWCGDIDIIGNKKVQSYYRDVIWEESNIEIMVHEPNVASNEEVTSFWGWPNEVASWNWGDHEGEILDVHVYSSYQEVQLKLNGELVGKKIISEEHRFNATFEIPYVPAELKAIGFDGGEIKDEQIIRTSSELSDLELTVENAFRPNRNDICFIEVIGKDKDGILVNKSMRQLTATVEGPAELLAAGNANPKIAGRFQDEKFRLFRGKGLIIV